MSPTVRLALGVALTLGGWLLTRASARAWRPARPWAFALDLFVPAVLFSAALAVTGRPVLAGVLIGAILGGIAFADTAKRRFLGEPVVFTDLGILPKLITRSELYIAFVGYGRVIGGALVAAAALAALFAWEPPLAPWSPLAGLLSLAGGALIVLTVAGPLVRIAAAPLRRLHVTGDPVRDSAELGLGAMQFTHGIVTRADRPARRARLAPPAADRSEAAGAGVGGPPGAPVLLFQLESFADPRRLHPSLADAALPVWDRLKARAAVHGRLEVPGVGGNTMRTEFEVLSGRGPEELGLDRLHPYQAFCRKPVDTLAWRLRARGYRTVCLHPYDRTFYGRDVAMPNLGFDRFLGEEAFRDAPRIGRYVSDVAVAETAARIVEEEGPAVFVFAITMGAHGPWTPEPVHRLPGLDAGATTGLGDYLARLSDTDRALAVLAALIERRGSGVLGCYGDHLPSLPGLFDALEVVDRRTDHLVWTPSDAPAPAMDLRAAELAAILLERAAAPSASAGARTA